MMKKYSNKIGFIVILVFFILQIQILNAANIASSATVSVSSSFSGFFADAMIDGVVDGYPGDSTKEWASLNEVTGLWAQLTWGSPVDINKIVLYDRPNTNDHITSGTLTFSDGSSEAVGSLTNDASSGTNITFSTKTITWVKFTVDTGLGFNNGLSEFEVLEPAPNNLALNATASASSSYPGYFVDAVKDGVVDGYPGDSTKEWASFQEVTGLWAQLTWGSPTDINQIVLYDRPNTSDHITSGTLTFSDGSSEAVGSLTNDASSGTQITFPSKTVTWVKFTVDTGLGSNNGLSEFEAYGDGGINPPLNIALNATPQASSTFSGYFVDAVNDGVVDGFPGDFTKEWAAVGTQGANITLSWASSQNISEIHLYDRPNTTDQIIQGTVSFSDSSPSLLVSFLTNDASSPFVLTFPQKNVSWVRLDIDRVSGPNTGLAEFEVYDGLTGSAPSPVIDLMDPYTIQTDRVTEGAAEAIALSPSSMSSTYSGSLQTWNLTQVISGFPQLSAPSFPLLETLYNMSLEEALLDITLPDDTFMGGANWPGVWTRDISYSIHMAFGLILPTTSRKSIDAKLFKDVTGLPTEIIQDTGSGGSWPVSTDRVVLSIAVWEYYLVTGDMTWLSSVYDALSYTAEKDMHVAWDADLALFNGETCSMDWRKRTYPNWFSNDYISESKSLCTNSLHSRFYDILSKIATELGKPAPEIAQWSAMHATLVTSINNNFWLANKGYYGVWLYPSVIGAPLSQKTGAVSIGMTLLFDVPDASRSQTILQSFPLIGYGAPTLYPTKPDAIIYHNKGIWPVWEAYLMLGAKKKGNIKVVEHIMKSIMRIGAMLLTNKENIVYDIGTEATASNSDRQLWSVASQLAIVYRVIFGMEFSPTGITFKSMVPDFLIGNLTLSNLQYRNSTLTIDVDGRGDEVDHLHVDGVLQNASYEFPSSSTGNHDIVIHMGQSGTTNLTTLVPVGENDDWVPVEPVLTLSSNILDWDYDAAYTYKIWDGSSYGGSVIPPQIVPSSFGTYNVIAIDSNGLESDLSNPVIVKPNSWIYEAEDGAYNPGNFSNQHSGYSGTGYLVDQNGDSNLVITFNVPTTGTYILRMQFANNNSSNISSVAVRSVFIDGTNDAGTLIMTTVNDEWPLEQSWNNYRLSNHIILDLEAGNHTFAVLYNPESLGYDTNMGSVNTSHLDYLEVIQK